MNKGTKAAMVGAAVVLVLYGLFWLVFLRPIKKLGEEEASALPAAVVPPPETAQPAPSTGTVGPSAAAPDLEAEAVGRQHHWYVGRWAHARVEGFHIELWPDGEVVKFEDGTGVRGKWEREDDNRARLTMRGGEAGSICFDGDSVLLTMNGQQDALLPDDTDPRSTSRYPCERQ